jgi:hypothetical protein
MEEPGSPGSSLCVRAIAVAGRAGGLTRRWWIAPVVIFALLLGLNFLLDRGTYPSIAVAERFLQRAVDGEWEALRFDGSPFAPQVDDTLAIESVDCQKDTRTSSDFPLFACVYRFMSGGQDLIAVVGAMHERGSSMTPPDGYTLYPWATIDQKALLALRGITFPITGT